MKKVGGNIAQNLVAVAMGERDILIRCQKINSVVLLMDSFAEKNANYLIIECPTGDNLKDTVLRQGKRFLKEAEVKKCMRQLLSTVKDIHRLRIKHGNICLESVIAR